MKISLIVPIYNGEAHLEQFVNCLKNITYKKVEYIFVDNNSTDNSILKLKHLLEQSNFEYSILSEEKQGAGHARNTGIRAAQGDLLAFLDCDDTINPLKFEHDVQIFKSNSTIDFVFCRAQRYYSDGREIKNPINGFKLGVNEPPELGLIWLKHYFYLQGPGSIIVKKNVVDRLGGFHTINIGEDAFLFIKLGLSSIGYFYDKTYYYYYRHPDSTVSKVQRLKNGKLLSYFTLRKELFNDELIMQNPIAKKVLGNQLQSDILKLNKMGYSIKELLNDKKIKELECNSMIFNRLSLSVNRKVRKSTFNPFYWVWLKLNK